MARKKKATFRPGPTTPSTAIPHVPITAKTKNLGAVKAIDLDHASVEKVASMEATDLGKHFQNNPAMDSQLKDAIMKRHLEIQNAKPKQPKLKTALRDKKTGKAIPLAPATPVVTSTPDPVIKKFKKGQLVTVKPRKQKKQTPIAKPQPGQAGKLDGQTVRVTPENADQVYEQRRRTELPAAGPAEMTPTGRPEIEGAILPRELRGSQNKKNLGGFAQSHKIVAKATHEALGHLNTMANTDKGSPEHHNAHEAFNLLHGQIGQIGNKPLHRDLGLGRTIIQQYHGSDKLPEALKLHRGIVLGRLEEGKIAEQSRGERSGPRKEGQ
jgi:hypothetical protein